MAIIDNLTRIYNRMYLNEALHKEVEHAKRYKKPLAIIIMDIDDFKQYNDNFGHLQGDVVLKQIANTLSKHLRGTDILARFGGDEFIVILPETDQEGLQTVAEKLGKAIRAQTFHGESVGVSIGTASFQPEWSSTQLVEQADRDMYQRKAR